MALKKDLTLTGLTMIAIGACIGSGIFVTPASTMEAVGHHGWVLLIWAIGGLVTFLGAMTFSELGARYPKSGGVYVYLKEAYGDIFGFLYGWIILLIVNTGALAALATVFANYVEFFVELSATSKYIISIGTIVGLTLINVIGVNISQIFATVFTSLKLIALLIIIVIGLYFWPTTSVETNMNLMSHTPDNLLQGILVGFVGVFWSFGGWHHATYLSGETKNPQRNVPKAMLIGTLAVTTVYLLVIFAYMQLISGSDMVLSEKIAGDAMAQVITGGGKLVTIAITISIFGTIGIYTMTAPRIYHAMAKDGLFFDNLAKLHPKYHTPYVAMLLQMVWACVLILIWGTFHNLMTFVTFMDIIFMALATGSIFIFRCRDKENDVEPAYKLGAYPIVPIIYLLVTIAFVVNTLIALPAQSWAGVGILLIGVPAFYYFKRNSEKETKR